MDPRGNASSLPYTVADEGTALRRTARAAGDFGSSGPGFIGYQLKNIGDALMCLPGLALLKRLAPGCRTALVARPAAAGLLAGSPDVDKIYVTAHASRGLGLKATFGLAREIGRERWDTAFGFDHKGRSGILSLLAGQRRRVASRIPGYEDPAWPWQCAETGFAGEREGDTVPPSQIHMAEHQARLCAWALDETYREGPGRLLRPRLAPPTPEAEEEAAGLYKLIPGDAVKAGLCLAGRQPEKCWHLLNWKAVAEGLYRSRGATFCVTGGPEDGIAARALAAMTDAPVEDLTGRTTLGGFRALCARLDLFMSVDTGSAHLAALAGTPLLVVYTASSPALWTPMSDRIRLLCYDWALKRQGLPLEPPPGAAPWKACGIPGPTDALAAAESLLDLNVHADDDQSGQTFHGPG
jgi:ADP-heptose:LPS heptosyltransferase